MSTIENPPVDGVDAALRFAEAKVLPDQVYLGEAGDLVALRQRAGESWLLQDLRARDEAAQMAPSRPKGTVQVHDAVSFASALERHTHDEHAAPVVYVDETALAVVAVLNDDDHGAAGWRDHRVALALRPTPEWTAWKQGQGLGEQKRFAERIEDGLPEIVSPAGSVMLELAQTFHAAVDVKFRSGNRLADGQTQFLYDEDVKASAGTKPGSITIPEEFTLGVAPFFGSERYEVHARLRYRLKQQELAIGYTLVRPETVERDAFTEVVAGIRSLVVDGAVLFVNGPAPTARS